MNQSPKTVFVTGGAGFIGSNLIPKLLSQGHKVIVFDNFSTGVMANLEAFKSHTNFAFEKGDIRDREAVQSALQNVTSIIHLAAQIDVTASVENPLQTHEINVTGTLNLLQEAAKNKVEKFVFASSTAVYGETTLLPIKEETPTKPISPYAASKAAAESYLSAYAHCFGLETITLRFFNVYGKKNHNSPYSGVITKFLQKAQNNQNLTVEGDGEQTRDFIHVSDVVNGIALALNSKQTPGEVFNICTGKPTSINQLAEIIKKITCKDLSVKHGPPRVGDIKHNYGNPTKTKKALRFEATVDLAAGLRTLVENENP